MLSRRRSHPESSKSQQQQHVNCMFYWHRPLGASDHCRRLTIVCQQPNQKAAGTCCWATPLDSLKSLVAEMERTGSEGVKLRQLEVVWVNSPSETHQSGKDLSNDRRDSSWWWHTLCRRLAQTHGATLHSIRLEGLSTRQQRDFFRTLVTKTAPVQNHLRELSTTCTSLLDFLQIVAPSPSFLGSLQVLRLKGHTDDSTDNKLEDAVLLLRSCPHVRTLEASQMRIRVKSLQELYQLLDYHLASSNVLEKADLALQLPLNLGDAPVIAASQNKRHGHPLPKASISHCKASTDSSSTDGCAPAALSHRTQHNVSLVDILEEHQEQLRWKFQCNWFRRQQATAYGETREASSRLSIVDATILVLQDWYRGEQVVLG